MLEDKKIMVVTVVTVAVILIAVPLVYLYQNPMDSGDGDGESELITVEGEKMSLDDLEKRDAVSGSAKYQNRFGNWNEKSSYEGVPLNDLVPEMDSNDAVEVTASDGYSMTYSYDQVNPTGGYADIQGDLILAYKKDDIKVPDWEGGPQIAILPPDEEFSNDDINMTKNLASEFSRQGSAGSLWVKMVEKIELKEDIFSDSETTLTLEGTTTHDYTMEQIESMESYTGEGKYINRAGSVEGPFEYRGVNVTKLVSNIYSDNDYKLEVEATDGYTIEYSKEQVNGQFTIYDENGDVVTEEGDVTLLLAYKEIGEDSLQDGPLKVVTVSEDPKITSSQYWAKMVRYLKIKPTGEEGIVTVGGEDMTLSDLESMETVTGTVKYQNRFQNWNEMSEYKGVALNDLITDMDHNDAVQVTASDGYSMKYSYGEINPTSENQEIQGDIILAYEKDGSKVPDWEDGPRIAVLPEDEEFSNADHNITKSLASEFNRQTSASSLWVKMVEKIELKEDVYPDNETALTLEGTTEHNYTMEEIMSMESFTGTGSFLNSVGNIEGPWEYKGVNVTKLVSNMYNEDDYTLEVVSSDGYTMTFSDEQVDGQFTIFDEEGNVKEENGSVNMILGYMKDGETNIPDGPLRIALVTEDGETTESHFWSKYVRTLKIKGAEEDWSLHLDGLTTMDMDKQTFESAATCDWHNVTYTEDGDTYTGLALYILVSAVDGADAPEGHYMFNTELAEKGYNVTLVAGDGYSIDLPSQMVAKNKSLLLANRVNGEPLPERDFPLRLVGPNLSGKQRIKNVVEIKLTDLPETSNWTLTLNGEVNIEFDSDSFNSMVGCGAHTEYYNYTEGDTDYSYKGVPLWILVGAVDDDESGDHWTFNDTLANEGYRVNVIASDGYNYSFKSTEVARNDSMIITSRLNGEPLPEDVYPLRLVGEDLSGRQMVSMIDEIELIFQEPSPSWPLKLNGTSIKQVDASEYKSKVDSGEHTVYHNYTDSGTAFHYKGLPLWYLVGAVDDQESGEWTLNDTLVSEGYNVTVIAEDGYSYTFDISQVAHNDSIVVASELNDEPLPEEDAPLRIVGEGLSGKARVSKIVEISLSGIEPAPSWTLTLNGTVMENITSTEFNSIMESGHKAYQNITEDGEQKNFTGIPLWYLVAAVDDDESGGWTLNDTLVNQGYEVKVIAEDGYSQSFNISQVAHNDSIIVASLLNGEPLTEDAPLRIIGENLSSKMMVSMVVEIQLTGL
ncbi:MAG: molybdopterin-dependent oxidoreductase [Candidatus Saliniplasma sp.]